MIFEEMNLRKLYRLKQIFRCENNGVKSYGILFEDTTSNLLYFTSDRLYLNLFMRKYVSNQYVTLQSWLDNIGNKLNILVDIYEYDFSSLVYSRLFSEMNNYNLLAGEMCKKKFLSIIKNVSI